MVIAAMTRPASAIPDAVRNPRVMPAASSSADAVSDAITRMSPQCDTPN